MHHVNTFELPPEIQEPVVASLMIVSDGGWMLTLPFISGYRGLWRDNR